VLYYNKVNISDENKSKYNELISQGDKELELLAKGYTQAAQYYMDAIEIDPSQAYPYSKLVQILLLKRQYGKVDELLTKAKKSIVNGDICSIYIQIGDSYYKEKDFKNSINNYVECYNSSYGDYAKLYSAVSFLKQGNNSKAQELLDSVSNTDINIYSKAKLYSSYIKLENKDESKKILDSIDLVAVTDQELVKQIEKYKGILNKSYTDEKYYHTYIANYLLQQELYPLSLKLMEKYIDGVDEYYDGALVLSSAYYGVGEYDKAINTIQKVITLENRYEGYLVMARANRMINDQAQSVLSYKEAFRYSSSITKESILSEYIDYLVETNQLLLAEKELQSFIKQDNSEYINFELLKLYKLQNKVSAYSTSLNTLSKLSLSDGAKKRYLGYKIQYNLESKKYALVREDLESMIKIDRNNPEYYLLSARLELDDGDKEKSKEYINKAIDFDFVGDITKEVIRLRDRVE